VSESSFQFILAQAPTRVELTWARLSSKIDWNLFLKKLAEHSLLGGGKAVRPALVTWVASQISKNSPGTLELAVDDCALALECIHTYSLIHDDLPAMDNDDFRRGRPTLHRISDSASAILTGDALLTLAFEIIAQSTLTDSIKVKSIQSLAHAAGGAGMVAGQLLDLQMKTSRSSWTYESLKLCHEQKTGALFGTAFELGYLCAKGVSALASEQSLVRDAGIRLGFLFQVVDDVLDFRPESQSSEGPNMVDFEGLSKTQETIQNLSQLISQDLLKLGFDPFEVSSLLDFFVKRKV
jgi:geranylgeranyl pyrophosphate synthase